MNEFFDKDRNLSLTRGKRDTVLATWWRQITPGTTYWRCIIPARHLPGQVLPVNEETAAKDKDGIVRLPPHRGVAVWQFLGDEWRTQIAGNLQNAQVPTYLEIDDNYLREAPYMRGTQTPSFWKKTRAEAQGGYSHEMHKLIAPAFDAILCATDVLAEEYSHFNDNVHVCPNSVDPVDWEYERTEDPDELRLVYYGSPSHLVDAPIITKALKWATRQPGVTFTSLGFTRRAWSFPHRVGKWNDDMVAARKALFQFDLGFAPLVPNRWANCKSDLKALEYAMAGILPLMSDVPSFSPWRDAFPDLLMKTEDDWLRTVKWAVAHPEEVKERAAAVKAWVLATRAIEKTIHLWRNALDV